MVLLSGSCGRASSTLCGAENMRAADFETARKCWKGLTWHVTLEGPDERRHLTLGRSFYVSNRLYNSANVWITVLPHALLYSSRHFPDDERMYNAAHHSSPPHDIDCSATPLCALCYPTQRRSYYSLHAGGLSRQSASLHCKLLSCMTLGCTAVKAPFNAASARSSTGRRRRRCCGRQSQRSCLWRRSPHAASSYWALCRCRPPHPPSPPAGPNQDALPCHCGHLLLAPSILVACQCTNLGDIPLIS